MVRCLILFCLADTVVSRLATAVLTPVWTTGRVLFVASGSRRQNNPRSLETLLSPNIHLKGAFLEAYIPSSICLIQQPREGGKLPVSCSRGFDSSEATYRGQTVTAGSFLPMTSVRWQRRFWCVCH
ncbi:hypothetical protein LZ31DRAFT_187127 [Colletotrichum somersetense]|nr:hypothetical protein LZ31DRAFT_187127 [Colletotrichum somersetense]